MKILRSFADGLQNVVANLGMGRDKSAHNEYVDQYFSAAELLRIYRNSWLARAIVDYPTEDATRNWRSWRAEADQITKIKAIEKKLMLQKRVQDALVAARLYGGSAIYINTQEQNQDQPLRAGSEIKSLVVLTPESLQPESIVRDINSIYYGASEFYNLRTDNSAGRVTIHASRLVILRGAEVPADVNSVSAQTGNAWGDSVIQGTLDAITQMDGTMANIASLVFEAKVDVFKFDGFAQMMSEHQDEPVIRRLRSQAAMKGINGAVVIDMKDDYEQKSASFAGLPDVVSKFQDNVAGAAGIPVTRLYGRAAVGLSGSGDGDERVYYDRIHHEQTTEITPAMAHLDDCIIHQALGSRPPEIFYEWTPLRVTTKSERAEIFSKVASAARSIGGANAGELIPMDALSDSLVNELTEMGVLPGLQQSVEKYGSLHEQAGVYGEQEE